MKILRLFLMLFSPVFLTLSEVTYASQDRAYLQGLDDEFMRCASVFRNAQATAHQIEEAKADIEELAISGNLHSFNLLWDLRKDNSIEAKAEFVRDFLVNDLHPVAITNVSNKIIEYQNAFPSFFTILQGLIDNDQDKEIINGNLRSILKMNPIIHSLFPASLRDKG